MAFASPSITAYAVEATEFPDLARRYRVTGVPKTIVNEEVEILGALPEEAFVAQALSKFTMQNLQATNGEAG
jgi:predicted DsbA family dithiol-disulfide isomerase